MCLANKIIPAQVPNNGISSAIRSRNGSMSSKDFNRFAIVVDSPPGKIKARQPASSSAVLTSIALAPHLTRASLCRAKAPCRAKTPTVLPATIGESNVKFVHANTGHRSTQTPANLGQYRRIVEVRCSLDDCLGAWRWVVTLKDT